MAEWMMSLLERTGYLGIVLLMLLENLFPPIPSEVVMPLAGFTAARGRLSLPLVIVAGTLGAVLGALPWYALGRALGVARVRRLAGRHGRWLTLTPGDVDRASAAFRAHGAAAVLVGRLVPAVRTLISVPAGVTRMALPRFLVLTTAGSLAWTAVLALTGNALGRDYGRVARFVGPVSNAIVVLILAAHVVRVIRWKPQTPSA